MTNEIKILMEYWKGGSAGKRIKAVVGEKIIRRLVERKVSHLTDFLILEAYLYME
jgi:hypothetical protein